MKNIIDKPIFEALCKYLKVTCAGGRIFLRTWFNSGSNSDF